MARRWLRRLALGGGVGLSLLGALGVGGVFFLLSPRGNELVRRLAVEQAGPLLRGGSLRVERLRFDGHQPLQVEGFALSDAAGEVVVGFDHLELDIDLGGILKRRVHIRSLELTAPVVRLETGADGQLNLSAVLGLEPSTEPGAPWGGLPARIELDRVEISQGELRYSSPGLSTALGDLELKAGAVLQGRSLQVGDLQLSASLLGPAPLALSAEGGLLLEGGDFSVPALDLRLGESRFLAAGRALGEAPTLFLELDAALRPADLDAALADLGLAPLPASPTLLGDLTLKGTARGALSDLRLRADLQSEAGALALDAQANLDAAPITWRLDLDTAGFDLERLLGAVTEPTHLVGHYAVTGAGSAWPRTLADLGPDTVRASLDISGARQVFWGEPVHNLHLQAELEGGVLKVQRLSGRHALGSVAVSGEVDLLAEKAKANGTVTLPDLDLLRRYGVEGWRGDARYAGGASVDWSGPQVAVEAEGALTAGALSGPGDLSVRSATLPLSLSLKEGTLLASGELSAEGIAAAGATVERGAGVWAVRRDPEGRTDLRLVGLHLDRVVAPDNQATAAAISGDIGVHLNASGLAGLNAELHIERALLKNGQQGQGQLIFNTAGQAISGQIYLHDEDGGPTLQANAVGDLGTGQWTVSDLALAPTLGMLWRSDAPAHFTLVEGGVRDLSLRLASAAGRISVEGDALPEAPRLQIELGDLDLAWVNTTRKEFLPPTEADPLDGLAGRLDLSLNINPGATVPTLDATLAVRGLALPSRLAAPVDLALTLREADERAVLDGTLKNGDTQWLALGGELPLKIDLKEGALDLRCEGSMVARAIAGPLSAAQMAQLLPELANSVEALSLDLQLSGSPCDPDLHVVGAATHRLETGEVVRLDVDSWRRASELSLTAAVETDLTQRLTVDGTAQTGLSSVMDWLMKGGAEPNLAQPRTWLRRLDLSVVPLALPIEELLALADSSAPLRGRLAGGIHVGGDVEVPAISAALQVVDGAIGDEELNLALVTLIPAQGGYSTNAQFGFVKGGGLAVEGFVPFELAFDAEGEQTGGALDLEGLSLKVSGEGLPLAMLSGGDTGISDASGLLRITGDITGSLGAPKTDLRLWMEGGALTLAANDVRYEDLHLDAELWPDRVVLRDSSVTTKTRFPSTLRPGRLALAGQIDLDDFSMQKVDLRAEMDGFLAMGTPATTLATSGKLQAHGIWPDLELRGDLALEEGRVVVTRDAFLNDASLLLSPDLVIYRPTVAGAASYRGERPSFWEGFDLLLSADLNNNLRLIIEVPTADSYGSQFADLSTVKLDASFTGTVDLTGEAGAPIVHGEVETANDRGKVEVLGATFDLEQGGTLNFAGDDLSNPILKLTANRNVGDYGTVTVTLDGHAQDLTVSPTSDEYPDPSDAFALLLFGKPTADLTDSEGQAGAVLLGVALSSLSGQVEQVVGLNAFDQFEIDPSTSAVRVGKALSDDLFLSIQIMPQTDPSDNVAQATVEWLIARRLYAAFVTGDHGRSSADLYWRWRF